MNHDALKPEAQGALSIEVGFALLGSIACSHQPMLVSEVAEAAGLPETRVKRFLQSFEASGFVRCDVSGRYELGPSAVLVGLAAQHRTDEFKLVDDALAKLQQSTGATASAVIWGNHGPTIIRRFESARAVTVTTSVGSVIPITRSSSGIVFGAFLASKLVDPRVLEELDRDFSNAHEREKEKTKFAEKVEDARRHGVATVSGDFIEGVDAIACPVFGPDGEVWVSLALLGPHGSFDLSSQGVPKTTLREIARTLSLRVGAPLAMTRHGVVA